jgi:predicted peptidase
MRSGVFYLPKGYDASKKYPLAVVLHGLGGDGAGMVAELKSLADSKEIILLGPDGFSRANPFSSGNTYYFNPDHVAVDVVDYTFVILSLKKIEGAFPVNLSKVLVAGMSMGAPATLFFSGHEAGFTHAAMLHGVTWNYDPLKLNDVANVPFFPWEKVPLGTFRPLFWYSTSVDDWVTNYDKMSGFGLSVNDDLAYVENAGYSVTHKFDYPGGHWMTDQEKADLVNWFLGN